MCRKSNKELDAWMEAEVRGYKDSQQKIPVTKLIREMLSLLLSKISLSSLLNLLLKGVAKLAVTPWFRKYDRGVYLCFSIGNIPV